MKIFTSIFKCFFIQLLLTCFCNTAFAQTDSEESREDTTGQLNMDAAYNRPFLTGGMIPLAIGGYLEANTQYEQTDGIPGGFHFQARRFTLFFSSSIANNIKFLSELEFEDGTREINFEFASIDIEFHHLLTLRGGIVMNPIGAFNQNHDGPNWDFVDRPLSATNLIPTTLSNVGFGLHGKYFADNWILGYETYLTNGFDETIIANENNRTLLAAGKENPFRFEESNSGLPMFTGKLAFRNRNLGEVGISFLTGVYNRWRDDGEILDKKRSVSIAAVDFDTSLLQDRLNITGEIARVFVDVPSTYSQQFGTDQAGGFVDFVGTLVRRQILAWEEARLNLGLRLEYADYNVGTFNETGGNIADDVWAVVPGIAFRPSGTSVLRFNYRYQQRRDLVGNPPEKTGAIQLGFSTYF